MLTVIHLDTLDLGEAAIFLGRDQITDILATVAVIGTGVHGGTRPRIDEVLDFLHEEPNRKHARRLEVVLGGEVEIVRELRLEAGIAGRDGPLASVGAWDIDRRRGNELPDRRPANVGGPTEARDDIGRRLVFEMYPGEDLPIFTHGRLPGRPLRADAALALRDAAGGRRKTLGGHHGSDIRRAQGAFRVIQRLQRAFAPHRGGLDANSAHDVQFTDLGAAHNIRRGNSFIETRVALDGH